MTHISHRHTAARCSLSHFKNSSPHTDFRDAKLIELNYLQRKHAKLEEKDNIHKYLITYFDKQLTVLS